VTRRQVTAVRVDHRGYVSSVADDGAPWSPRHTIDVITDIELGIHDYVTHTNGQDTPIDIGHDTTGVYLHTRTHPDGPNLLLDLPHY
jgi:hypothetical protein